MQKQKSEWFIHPKIHLKILQIDFFALKNHSKNYIFNLQNPRTLLYFMMVTIIKQKLCYSMQFAQKVFSQTETLNEVNKKRGKKLVK